MEVMLICHRTGRYHDVWLALGQKDRLWYSWEGDFFTNLSHADSDQVCEGDVVMIFGGELKLQTPWYASKFLDPSFDGVPDDKEGAHAHH